ncbi:hypothetical protein MATL_G00229500 [Megalops atlanticus]|uniref:Nuclear transcription factor Y subunit gamma n=2 Tax=Megalops TaxID=7931 RepID=A0A9D3PDD5_MEGAT|nr:hypothetical protein MATL_G00229500 [Megalops atlanticus]
MLALQRGKLRQACQQCAEFLACHSNLQSLLPGFQCVGETGLSGRVLGFICPAHPVNAGVCALWQREGAVFRLPPLLSGCGTVRSFPPSAGRFVPVFVSGRCRFPLPGLTWDCEPRVRTEVSDRVLSPPLPAGVIMSADNSFGAGGSDAQQSLQSFWPRVMEEVRNLTMKDFRVQELPLARIKKIMKLDEDVKMISAEAPVLFAKAAQIFITELTLRAWIHTEDNKRRTLQRNDIAMAITKFDQFDFLIDIVPRDELKPPKRQEEVRQSVAPAEPVQYYFTLAQQPGAVQVQGQQQGQQAAAPTTTTLQPGQIIIAQPQQGQVLQGATMQQLQQVQVAQSQATPITSAPVTMQVGEGQQVQIVQAAPQGQAQTAQPAGQTMQVMQQIITNTGEIQQIPVQLNTGQLQYIRLAQPVSGTQVVQGQIQTLATNAQQITQTEVQQGQQQFNQFTDGQQLYQIQQVTMPAGQELSQPMFIQSTSQTADGQVTTQVSAD